MFIVHIYMRDKTYKNIASDLDVGFPVFKFLPRQ
jgi:hypothetical protein